MEFMYGRMKVFLKDEFYPKYALNGFLIERDAFSQKTVMKKDVTCPKCNSSDVFLLKGDGLSINGLDFIGIVCNKCQKVYGFYDVNYKNSCPKEL